MSKKVLLIVIALLAAWLPLRAGSLNGPEGKGRETVLRFRVGESVIEPDFRDNRMELNRFCAGVRAALDSEDSVVEYVMVETGASPEGDPAANDRLAMRRARSVHDYLLTVLPIQSFQVKVYSRGIDWQGMLEIIKASDTKWREDILTILYETGVLSVNGYSEQKACLSKLRKLDGGAAWNYLMEGPFEQLRMGSAVLSFVVKKQLPEKDTLIVVHEYEGPDADWYLEQASKAAAEAATVAATGNVLKALEKKPKRTRYDEYWREPVVALRTNLLFPLLNAGVEVPLNNRWSIEADAYWPWVWREWMNSVTVPQSYCFEAMSFSVAPRFWFGVAHSGKEEYRKYRLTGHSLALVLQGGYFDFCYDWKGYQGEWFGAGLDYLYALPLGKGNVRLEFEAAVGIGYIMYRGYEVHEEGGPLMGNWDDGRKFSPLPMKLGVNLVVPIYRKDDKR